MYLSHLNEVLGGVATLFPLDLWREVLGVAGVMPGCLLHLQVCVEGLILNTYALIPSPEQVHFCWRMWAMWNPGSSGWPGGGRGTLSFTVDGEGLRPAFLP